MSFASDLVETGQRWLLRLEDELDEADPHELVAPRSRILCSALGALSYEASVALGASAAGADEVGLAGAALSLLTKLDDEVIDAYTFHGGPATPRDEVRRRTRDFLAPTLDALRSGARGALLSPLAAADRPRARFAHGVGRRLALVSSDAARLSHVLAHIELGWEVQASASAVLTAHPASMEPQLVLEATRSISGAWLGMITLVGELASEAARPLTDAEVDAIWTWGSFIQRADALCDLEKDQRDGLFCTFVAREAWAHHRSSAPVEPATLYGIVAREGIDVACRPSARERLTLTRALASLGRVDELLSWIFDMLYRRYLDHPLSVRSPKNDTAMEVRTCSAR